MSAYNQMARRTARTSRTSKRRQDRNAPSGDVRFYRGIPVHEGTDTFPRTKHQIIPKRHGTAQSATSWITGAGAGAEYFHVIHNPPGRRGGFYVVDIDPARATKGKHT